MQIGAAEVRSVAPGSLFDPKHQPEVYWHDPDWIIDVIKPPTLDQEYSLSIRSGAGKTATMKLPREYEQIESVLRGPEDKAIVVESDHTASGAFAIVDLKTGKMIDNVGVGWLTVSPNRRFIVFRNWYPNEAETYENAYRLYDVERTPRENLCGYKANDPSHKLLAGDFRGLQVFPQINVQYLCSDREDNEDDNMAADFVWSDDSSKLAFADMKSGAMSLVAVMTPLGPKNLPRTTVYPLVGDENICRGISECDFHVIDSLVWEGEAVKLRTRALREIRVSIGKFTLPRPQ